MKYVKSAISRLKQWHGTETVFPVYIIFLILLLVPVAFYWRYDLFFLWDDWTELDFISHNNFTKFLLCQMARFFSLFFILFFMH